MSLMTSTLSGAQKRLRLSNFLIGLSFVALVAMVLCYVFLPSDEAGFSKFAPFLIVSLNLVAGLLIRQTAQAQITALSEAS